MAKRFAYYYLQVNFGSAWETLEQSESVAVLNAGLADQLASPMDAQIRLVGANFDAESERWDYEQLFYIDQSSVDFGISDEPEFEGPESARAESPDRHTIGVVDQSSTPRLTPITDHGDTGERVPGPEPMDEREEINAPKDTPAPDEEVAAPPWLREPSAATDDNSAPPGGDFDENDENPNAANDQGYTEDPGVSMPWLCGQFDAADNDTETSRSFRPKTTPPRRRVSVSKIISIVFVFLFLALFIAVGALLYLQNSFVLDAADKLGIGEYLRLSTIDPAAVSDETKMASNSNSLPLVEPLTTGQVVRYVGVAPALRGRWSPRKCGTTYIEFDGNGYKQRISGQGAAGKTKISETLEDDFVFYLRRSVGMVEHYRKVTANDIKLAGTTTEGGFIGSANKVKIYSRCP
ncbi:MAG: hypothetical protein OSB69_23285, partial [Alphaproteobacteria bacterium]|nr:hypothetical protein [Alphaproteobacteria bacterium]